MHEEVIIIFNHNYEVGEGFFDIEAREPVKKFEIGNGFEQEIYEQGDAQRIIIRRAQSYDGDEQQDNGMVQEYGTEWDDNTVQGDGTARDDNTAQDGGTVRDDNTVQEDSPEVVSCPEAAGEALETLLESKCADYDRDYRGIRIDNSAADMKYENGIIILNAQLLKEGSKAIADRIEQLFKEG